MAPGGAVNLGSGVTALSASGSTASQIVVIENQSVGAVTGTFAGLQEGASVDVDAAKYRISYQGGPGNNDVVLIRGGAGAVLMVW